MARSRLPLAISLLATLLGCASSPPPLRPDFLAGMHRVSVVSVAADRLMRFSVGPFVMANESSAHNIADWSVDRAYEEQLAQAVEQVFRATVVRDSVATDDFSAVNLPAEGQRDVPNWPAIEATVRRLCQARRLDAVLVVAKNGIAAAGPDRQVYSVYIHKPQDRADARMSLRADLGLFDCTTGKPANVQELQAQGNTTGSLLGRNLPMTELPGAMGRAPMTSTWKPEVRARLIAMPQSSWVPALQSMLPAQKP